MIRRLDVIVLVALYVCGVSFSAAHAVVGGTVAPPGSPLEKVTFSLISNNGVGCTATAVGPRALVTSAICVVPTQSNWVATDDGPIEVHCEKYPTYDRLQNGNVDYALCYSDEALPLDSIAKINFDPSAISPGRTVLLAGRGCTALNSSDGIGQATQGRATVADAPRFDRPYMTTIGAASCPGDAGGGVFDSSILAPNPLLLGIQSRGDNAQLSYSSSLSASEFRSWASTWAVHGVLICSTLATDGACQAQKRGIRSAQSRRTENTPQSVLRGVLYSKNERLSDVVKRVCSDADSHYYEIFDALQAQNGRERMRPDTTFDSPGMIDLPACLRKSDATPQVKTVVTHSGDTLTGLLHRESDATLWKTLGRSGLADTESTSWTDVVAALNPSLNVSAPLPSGTRITVPTQPLSPENVPSTSTGSQPQEPVPDVAMTDTELLSEGKECKGSNSSSYPYDLGALLDVLASDQGDRGTVKVLVGDIGVYLSKYGPITRSSLGPTNTEASDFENYQKSITPLQAGSKTSHGTQVASLVLGGPIFSRLSALSDVARIKVKPARLYSEITDVLPDGKTQMKFTIQPKAFDKVVDDAFYDAPIVNLSLKYYDEIDKIKSAVETKGNTLFVVAAGNDNGLIGQPPAGTRVYPALYGGKINPSASNLIAVGAIDGNGRFAEISNFGDPYVEIAAPGCEIPVVSFDEPTKTWTIEKLSGTSLSAPLVSFTAALLKSYAQDWSAAEIKRRILMSADLSTDTSLNFKVQDRRTLNVPKTLSLWHDVLEIQGEKTWHRGMVRLKQNARLKDDDDSVQFICNGQTISLQARQILKVAGRYTTPTNDTVIKLYYKPTLDARNYESRECQSAGDLAFSMKDIEAGNEQNFPLDQVKDYVRREY